jgi:uncharacterized protein with von Willebrand factor type A (vWA) domain
MEQGGGRASSAAVPAVVERDSYDARAFSGLLSTPGELRAVRDEGARLMPGFEALLGDLYAALYKFNVVIAPEAALPASALLHRAIVERVLGAPAYREIRRESVLDEELSGAGAAALARELLRAIRRDLLLDEGELLSRFELTRDEEELRGLSEEAESAEELAGEQGEGRGEAAGALEEARRELEAALAARGRAMRARRAEEAARAKALPRSLSAAFSGVLAGAPARLREDDLAVEAFARGVAGAGEVDPAARLALRDRVAKSEKLKRLGDLVGAFRAMALAARRRRLERRPEELYEVTRGRDIGRLLSSELSALGHPARRRDFLRRFAEGELMTYALRGEEPRGRGPILVCLDVSSSMAGDKELWSKAVALALQELARRGGRGFAAICFSAPPAPLFVAETLSPKRGAGGRAAVDLVAAAKLAEHFPGGGTDFGPPLRAALERIRKSGRRRADIVFITDGESEVPKALKEELAAEKKRLDFALYAVLVDVGGSSRRSSLAGVADKLTTVSRLTDEATRKLFEDF